MKHLLRIAAGTLAMIACAAAGVAMPAPGVTGRSYGPQAATMAALLFVVSVVLRGRLRWPLADLVGALVCVEVIALAAIAFVSGLTGTALLDSFNLRWLATINLFVAGPWLAGMFVGSRVSSPRVSRPPGAS